MKKKLLIIAAGGIIVIAVALALSRSGPPQPTAEEEAVLTALKNVQEGYGRRVTHDTYAALLDAATQKIDQLKKAGARNSCFMNAAERSYSSFEMGEKAWQAKDEALDENRRIDMETTLSFTIGFASISLAKANECFYK
ncbi:MAG: hypothetical protein WAM73_05710 [Desulfobacterales bacterium]